MMHSRRRTPNKSLTLRKRWHLRGMLALGVFAAIGLGGCGQQPSLTFADDTPADLQELAGLVWEEFRAVFPNQDGCSGQVTLQGSWDLEGSRAFYLPEERRIVLKIPATAAHLRHSFVHELAHHLEHSCPDQAIMRDDFLEAQGLENATPWFEGPSWEETPSEQYAEAVVRLVLERPAMHYRIHINADAIEVIRKWGGGG